MLNLANVMTGNITIAAPAKPFVQERPVISRSGNVIPFETHPKKRV